MSINISNFKVIVKDESESNEVKQLFIKMGGKIHHSQSKNFLSERVGIVIFREGYIIADYIDHEKHYDNKYKLKNITIEELRKMVKNMDLENKEESKEVIKLNGDYKNIIELLKRGLEEVENDKAIDIYSYVKGIVAMYDVIDNNDKTI